jgi:hypothetical protein
MHRFHPPALSVVQPLTKYFGQVLSVWDAHHELASTDLVKNITANLANIRSIVQDMIQNATDEMQAIGCAILHLDHFLSRIYGYPSDLFTRLPDIIVQTGDPALDGATICARLERHGSTVPESEAEGLICRAIQIFKDRKDTEGEGEYIKRSLSGYS